VKISFRLRDGSQKDTKVHQIRLFYEEIYANFSFVLDNGELGQIYKINNDIMNTPLNLIIKIAKETLRDGVIRSQRQILDIEDFVKLGYSKGMIFLSNEEEWFR